MSEKERLDVYSEHVQSIVDLSVGFEKMTKANQQLAPLNSQQVRSNSNSAACG
jgi:hypothetical protein